MLYVRSDRILAIVTQVLEERVMPAVGDRDARGQLWAAIGLLDNLAGADQDSATLTQQLLELRRLIKEAPLELTVTPATSSGELELEDQIAVEHGRLNKLLEAAARIDERTPALDSWLEKCRAVLSADNTARAARMRSTRYGSAVRGD